MLSKSALNSGLSGSSKGSGVAETDPGAFWISGDLRGAREERSGETGSLVMGGATFRLAFGMVDEGC